MKKTISPLLKYSIVGGIGTVIDILILFFLVDFLKVNIFIGTFLSFIFVATNIFFANKFWTFENSSNKYRHQYIKFLIVSSVGLFLTMLLMFLFIEILAIWYITAKLFTSVIVMLWNFFGNKLWTFNQDEIVAPFETVFRYDLSILIPAFNEENRLEKTVLDIQHFLKENEINSEIIIINDGSTDNTLVIANKLSEKFPNIITLHLMKNQGKGWAIKSGAQKACGKHILYTDADGATSMDQYWPMKSYIEKYDIVIGSRYLDTKKIITKQPILRRYISSIGRFIRRQILVRKIEDTQCGFKLFKHNVAKDLISRQQIKGWAFDIELLAIAQNKGYSIKEVPIEWNHKENSKLNSLTDSFETLIELLNIKLNFILGRYK